MGQVRDFGAVLPARPFRIALRAGLMLAAAASLLVFVAVGVGSWARDQAADRAYAAAWTVAGPPCPRIGPGWYAKLAIDHPTRFDFGAAHGDFAHGAVSCTMIDYDHGKPAKPFTVCELSAPFAVRLDTRGGRQLFEPGSGQPITLSFAGAAPTCVIGAPVADWWKP